MEGSRNRRRSVLRSALNGLERWGGNGGRHSTTGPPHLLRQIFTDYSRPGRWVRGPLLCQRQRKCTVSGEGTPGSHWFSQLIKTESFEAITGTHVNDVNKEGRCARTSLEEDLVSWSVSSGQKPDLAGQITLIHHSSLVAVPVDAQVHSLSHTFRCESGCKDVTLCCCLPSGFFAKWTVRS